MIVLFDVNGTLTDPGGLGGPWDRPDLGLDMLQTAVQTGMVDALLGEYRPFSEHVRAGIETVARREGLDPELVATAADRAAHLDPWPDAAEALELLRGRGFRLATLTNSGADAGRRTLEAAGLADRFDHFLGVDAVRTPFARSSPTPARTRTRSSSSPSPPRRSRSSPPTAGTSRERRTRACAPAGSRAAKRF